MDSEPEGLLEVDDRVHRVGVIVILLLAAGLRLWAIDFGLPHLRARPDEYAIVDYTTSPAKGEFAIPWSGYPHTYFQASWLWGAAGLAVAQAIGLAEPMSYVDAVARDRATVMLILRLFSALAGTLTVWLAMRLARSTFGKSVALAAGALVATNFLNVRESHMIKPDIFCALGVLFAFRFIPPLARKATPRRGLVAGLASAVAMGAKYPAVILAVPVYLAALMGSKGVGWRRFLPAPAITAALGAAGLFALTNPFVLFGSESLAFWNAILRATHPSVLSDDGGRESIDTDFDERFAATMRSEGMTRVSQLLGYGDRPWWYGFAKHTRVSLRYGVGLLPTLLIPLALLWAVLCTSERLRAFCWPAVAFAVAYFGLFGLSPAANSRYMTPVVPLLLILVVAMVAAMLEWGVRERGFSRAYAIGGLALATLSIGAEGLAASIAHDAIAARTDTRVLASRWLDANAPMGARIKDIGTVALPYGRPQIPKGRKPSRAEATPQALHADRVSFVVTHDHVLYASTVDPEVFASIEPYLTLLADFDPAEGARGLPDEAVWETDDAYYIPIHGFRAVRRPGPHVRIYAFEFAGPLDSSEARSSSR